MPMVRIELLSGRSLDEKRTLVRQVTDAIVASLDGIEAQGVKIQLVENLPENTARGGVLRVDQ